MGSGCPLFVTLSGVEQTFGVFKRINAIDPSRHVAARFRCSAGSVQAAGRSLSQDTVASFYRDRPQSCRNWRAELALCRIGIPGREPPNSGSAGLDHKGNPRPAPGSRHFPFKVSSPRPFPSIEAAMLALRSRWAEATGPRIQSIRTLAAASCLSTRVCQGKTLRSIPWVQMTRSRRFSTSFH